MKGHPGSVFVSLVRPAGAPLSAVSTIVECQLTMQVVELDEAGEEAGEVPLLLLPAALPRCSRRGPSPAPACSACCS